MTGLTQLSGKIAEYNAEKLGTEYFEVEWHAGARPTHTIWQGRVWSQQQLYDVCGLGTVIGLCGAATILISLLFPAYRYELIRMTG